jgi:hypothetical protein
VSAPSAAVLVPPNGCLVPLSAPVCCCGCQQLAALPQPQPQPACRPACPHGPPAHLSCCTAPHCCCQCCCRRLGLCRYSANQQLMRQLLCSRTLADLRALVAHLRNTSGLGQLAAGSRAPRPSPGAAAAASLPISAGGGSAAARHRLARKPAAAGARGRGAAPSAAAAAAARRAPPPSGREAAAGGGRPAGSLEVGKHGRLHDKPFMGLVRDRQITLHPWRPMICAQVEGALQGHSRPTAACLPASPPGCLLSCPLHVRDAWAGTRWACCCCHCTARLPGRQAVGGPWAPPQLSLFHLSQPASLVTPNSPSHSLAFTHPPMPTSCSSFPPTPLQATPSRSPAAWPAAPRLRRRRWLATLDGSGCGNATLACGSTPPSTSLWPGGGQEAGTRCGSAAQQAQRSAAATLGCRRLDLLQGRHSRLGGWAGCPLWLHCHLPMSIWHPPPSRLQRSSPASLCSYADMTACPHPAPCLHP